MNKSIRNKRCTRINMAVFGHLSVVSRVNQIVFGEHTLLCFLINLILIWRRVMIKNSYQTLWFKSCLARGEKQKKQLGLYLVIYLYASGAHFGNNSKGPIHFMPPATKRMWEWSCYFHSARHLLLIKKKILPLIHNDYPGKWCCRISAA